MKSQVLHHKTDIVAAKIPFRTPQERKCVWQPCARVPLEGQTPKISVGRLSHLSSLRNVPHKIMSQQPSPIQALACSVP